MSNMIGISRLRQNPDENTPVQQQDDYASDGLFSSLSKMTKSLANAQTQEKQAPKSSISLNGRQANIQDQGQQQQSQAFQTPEKRAVEQKILGLISTLADQLASPECDVDNTRQRMLLLQDLISSVKSL